MTSSTRSWPFGDGLGRGVDGVALVVARLPPTAVIEVVLEDSLLDFGRQPFHSSVDSATESSGRWEGVQREG